MNRIETSIEVAAAPSEVWRVITGFDRYADWNPFVTTVEGQAALGAAIMVTVRVLGASDLRIPAEITQCEPDRVLAWRSHLLTKGVFDREHIIEIEPNATGCVLRNTQTFEGPLAAPAALLGTPVVRHGLQRMNDALKRTVETAGTT